MPSRPPQVNVSIKNPVPPSSMLAAPLTRVKVKSIPVRRRQKLVLAHIQRFPGRRCSPNTCPAPSRLKAILPGPRAEVMNTGMPASILLSAPFMGLNSNFHPRILPQQNVMLEINRRRAEFQVEHGDQFAFNVISDAAKNLVGGRGCQ